MSRVKLLLLAPLLLLTLFLVQPVAALDILKPACNSQTTNGSGATSTKLSPTCQQNAKHAGDTVNPVIVIIHDAANLIGLLAGIIAVFIVMYSGFRFIVSGNNPEGQKQARSTLIGAIIGLVIIALAWAIVSVVINLLF